jgi:hypothetical protein
MANKKIGILNKGKNNTFTDNTFLNLDVGIQDEGENTIAQGNEFLNINDRQASENKREEILKLSPEIYGVGFNLKALWSRITNYFKSK